MPDHPADRAGREVAKSLKLGFYWVFFHFWRKGWDKSSNPDQSVPVQEVPDSSGFLADHVSQHVRTCAIASDADLYLGLYTGKPNGASNQQAFGKIRGAQRP
jgi:hypothetical protein